MDTSETYIKMRLAARKDLLDGTPPKLGWDEVIWLTAHVFVDWKGDFYFANGKDQCQLERQDQLQEVYESFRNENIHDDDTAPLDSINIAQDFNAWLETFTKKEPYSWLNNPTDIRGWVQPSMEQLWLAFCMSEKFNKIWDGESWVVKK